MEVGYAPLPEAIVRRELRPLDPADLDDEERAVARSLTDISVPMIVGGQLARPSTIGPADRVTVRVIESARRRAAGPLYPGRAGALIQGSFAMIRCISSCV